LGEGAIGSPIRSGGGELFPRRRSRLGFVAFEKQLLNPSIQ
jgi:hypothetical protein